MEDLGEIISHVQVTYKASKYALFAHSMGSLIVSGYLQKYVRAEFYPSCIFLSAPPVGVPGVMGTFLNCVPVKMLSQLPLSVRLKGLIDINYLSHDHDVIRNYESDPLNILNLHTKLLLKLIVTARKVYSRPINPKCPAFVVVGSSDEIVSFSAIKKYFTFVEKNFHLEVYEGAFHELHNEIEEYRVPYFRYLVATIARELG